MVRVVLTVLGFPLILATPSLAQVEINVPEQHYKKMLRILLRVMKSRVLFLPLLGLCLAAPAASKCISLEIVIRGQVVGGPMKGMRVEVEVASSDAQDDVTRMRQKSSISGDKFEITAWFDTTSNVINEETCNRSPRLVVVKLLGASGELDKKDLAIVKDFQHTKDGYEAVSAVELHAYHKQ